MSVERLTDNFKVVFETPGNTAEVAAENMAEAIFAEIEDPDAQVLSVNGEVGHVTLNPADVGAAPASHTHLEGDVQLSGPDVLVGRVTAGPGGAEEVPCTAAGRGLLAAANAAAQRSALELGGAAVLSVGTVAGTVAAGDDSRLSDTRTPTAHAASHASGQSDAVTPAAIGALGATAQAADSAKLVGVTPGVIGLALLDDATASAARSTIGAQAALGFTPENAANKGAANGYAGLDSAGKVPVAQLPSSIMEYKGTWNASTNAPTLADGTGDPGDVYRVTVAGSRNLGSGTIDFQVGDYVIYSGTVWEKSDTTDAVASVDGRTGTVTLSDLYAALAHAARHQNGGADEIATATPTANAIPKASASGKLDGWVTDGSTTAKGKVELATDGETAAGVAVQGNDARLSNARTPTAHAATHNAGGADALAIDAAAATGSLRTLGTAATAACAGNDARLSNARTPTAHAASHASAGGDAITPAAIGAQAADATLTALAGLAAIADRLPYFNGTDTAAMAVFTAAGRAILDDASADAQLTTLGAGAGGKLLLALAALSSLSPAMDGTAAAGTSDIPSRQDHVHPTDTSRLAAAAYTAADVLAKLLTVDTDTAGINATTLKSVTPGAGGLLLLALAALSTLSPAMNGTAAAGTSNIPSRQDHVHPTDTGRAAASHASRHNAGGADALAADAAAATASLRTLGTAATAACAGNDARLSNARTPTAHASAGAAHTFTAADKILGRATGGAGNAEEIACTAAGRALLDDANATAQRATLGLGDSATKNVGTAADTVCAGNDSRLTGGGIAPAGTVVMYAGPSGSCPTGWLTCNGGAIPRASFATLFAAFGGENSPWGLGDGSTTFNLPDFREVAPVGLGTWTYVTGQSRANGSLAVHDAFMRVGEFGDDRMQGHRHGSSPNTGSSPYGGFGVAAATQTAIITTGDPVTDGANGTPRTGLTTRGKRLCINFIVKY